MKQLHDVRVPLPYPDVPIMDWEAFQDVPETDEGRRGYLLRMWIEDNRVTGLWRPRGNPDDRYIVNLSDDYRVDDQVLREDAAYINNHDNGSSYYLYDGHVLEHRGETYCEIDTGQQELF